MLDDVNDRAQRKQKKKKKSCSFVFLFFFNSSSRVSRCRRGDITKKKKKPQVVKEKKKKQRVERKRTERYWVRYGRDDVELSLAQPLLDTQCSSAVYVASEFVCFRFLLLFVYLSFYVKSAPVNQQISKR